MKFSSTDPIADEISAKNIRFLWLAPRYLFIQSVIFHQIFETGTIWHRANSLIQIYRFNIILLNVRHIHNGNFENGLKMWVSEVQKTCDAISYRINIESTEKGQSGQNVTFLYHFRMKALFYGNVVKVWNINLHITKWLRVSGKALELKPKVFWRLLPWNCSQWSLTYPLKWCLSWSIQLLGTYALP